MTCLALLGPTPWKNALNKVNYFLVTSEKNYLHVQNSIFFLFCKEKFGDCLREKELEKYLSASAAQPGKKSEQSGPEKQELHSQTGWFP